MTNEPLGPAKEEPISFPGWAAELQRSVLTAAQKKEFRQAIGDFLAFCRARHLPVTLAVIGYYLARPDLETRRASARDALRWFVRAGKHPAVRKAADDPRRGERR